MALVERNMEIVYLNKFECFWYEKTRKKTGDVHNTAVA